MRIPRTTEEITPEWLTEALRAGGHLDEGRAESVQFERIGIGLGFASLVARGVVHYADNSGDAPTTIVAKLPSGHAETDELVTRMGFADREVRFFSEIALNVGVPVPRHYYADSDRLTGEYVLLLEDLSEARPGDQVNGCSPEDAELVVRNLAMLHARWWESGQLDSLDWLFATANPETLGVIADNYRSNWERVAAAVGSRFPDGVYTIAERLGPHFEGTMRPLGESPVTLNHGDGRLGNLFFRDNGGSPEVVRIDWQLASQSRGAADLAYFIIFSFSLEERRRHEGALLHIYHDALAEYGVSGYSFDQLNDDYRLGLFRFLTIGVGALANLDMDSEAGRATIEAGLPRLTGLVDWDCGAQIPD